MIMEHEFSDLKIADIYPLSPLQQGMLFHTLYAPESGVYIEAMSFRIKSDLNIVAFEQAWHDLVARYSVFRTAFIWEEIKQPLQVVYHEIPLRIWIEDWRHIDPAQRPDTLERFLRSQQRQGFPLNEAPLMRLYLIELTDDEYQFVWVHHHLLLDGWSSPIVFQELLSDYEALCRGESWTPEPTPPYRDYISWLLKQDRSQAETFWKQTLQGFTVPTSLQHLQQIGIPEEATGYRERELFLSAQMTGALETFAKQHQLTINTLVQGAWALLLARYSGQSDVAFGATVSGRPPTLNGVDRMVGLFINTLPLRVKIAAQDQVVPWLRQLQSQQVAGNQFDYTALVDIQSWSELPSGVSLFDTLVVFENYPMSQIAAEHYGNLQIDDFQGLEQTNYPLTLGVSPGKQLLLKISYDATRFCESTIERLLAHLQTLLIGIVENPERPISTLPMLTAPEQQQLLWDWNDTQIDYPQDLCVHQLFEQQVERTPNALAVVCGDKQLTYQQLNQRANQLAHYLQTLGVKAETLVGLCVGRSLEMIVGMLAILKAGGAYVPLDPDYPPERLAYMLADAQIPVLLTQEKLTFQFPTNDAQVVCLDRDWPSISTASSDNLASTATPENLAYVIYTSGSTGQPKGVMITGQNLLNFCQAAISAYEITSADRILQFASVSFDAAVEEIYPGLIQGATIYLRTPEMLGSAKAFSDGCQLWQLTFIALPTAYWHQLAADLTYSQARLPHSVRLVIIGGERANPTQVRLWQEQMGEYPQLINT
jgi:non-ribosomal peptide synthetase component F